MGIKLILYFMQFPLQLVILEFQLVDHDIRLLCLNTNLPW